MRCSRRGYDNAFESSEVGSRNYSTFVCSFGLQMISKFGRMGRFIFATIDVTSRPKNKIFQGPTASFPRARKI